MAEVWLGKEMLRQAELRLQAQAAALAALEGRAGGLLAICGPGILAVGAAIVTRTSPAWFAGALVTGGLLFIAAAILVVFLWPQDWGVVGIDPKHMAVYAECEENDCLAAMAESLSDSVGPNARRLRRLGAAVKLATVLLLLAGPAGLLASQCA